MSRQAPRRAAAAKAANKIKRELEEEQLWFDKHGKSPKRARESALDQLEEDTKQKSKAKDVDTGLIYDNTLDANATQEMLDTTSERHGSSGSNSSQLSLDIFASTGIPSSEPSALQHRNAHQKRRGARQVHRTSDKRPSRRGEWRMSSPIYSPLVPNELSFDFSC